MSDSIWERIMRRVHQSKELDEEERKHVYDSVVEGEVRTAQEMAYYKLRAKEAIEDARRFAKTGDVTGKSNAMQELKTAYAFYQYMTSLHNGFRTMKSQMDMQMMTRDFANVVKCYSDIKVSRDKVNFADLTRKALKNFKPVDSTGLNEMVEQLMRGSIRAVETEDANDAYLEALVSGAVSLDAPYPSQSLQALDEKLEQRKAQAAAAPEAAPAAGDDDDVMGMLDKILAGLKGGNN